MAIEEVEWLTRVGKLPINIPDGVIVEHDGSQVKITGPKGTLARLLPKGIGINQEDNTLKVFQTSDDKYYHALHGTSRALLNNMVEGVTKGFNKGLELVGVGYRASKQGNKLILTVGYSQPVEMVPLEGLEVEVPAPNKIIVHGIDKEKVGLFAAQIRAVREPEPYKGKGIKYDKEKVRRKAGKTGAKK